MLEWPRLSVYDSADYLALRTKILNPGPGTPKAWAYPWCILNGRLDRHLVCLDFGCGSWTNFPHAISEATDFLTVGVDLGNLQPDTEHVRFFQTPSARLCFPDNFFDRIFSVSVLEHVPPPLLDATMRELFRVLRPGGLAVLTIDWVFGMDVGLASRLSTSRDLGKIGSNIFGNLDFAKIVTSYADLVSPLQPIDPALLPGSPNFDEARMLADEDILVTLSHQVTDIDLFKYTTVGIILRKNAPAAEPPA